MLQHSIYACGVRSAGPPTPPPQWVGYPRLSWETSLKWVHASSFEVDRTHTRTSLHICKCFQYHNIPEASFSSSDSAFQHALMHACTQYETHTTFHRWGAGLCPTYEDEGQGGQTLGVECGAWKVKCGVWNMECGLCGVWSLDGGVWSVKRRAGVWRVERGV